jgi:hypothetical protein
MYEDSVLRGEKFVKLRSFSYIEVNVTDDL